MGCIEGKQKKPIRLTRNKPLDNMRDSQIADAPRTSPAPRPSENPFDIASQVKSTPKNGNRRREDLPVEPLSNKAKKIIDSLVDSDLNKPKIEPRSMVPLKVDDVETEIKDVHNRSTDNIAKLEKSAVKMSRMGQRSLADQISRREGEAMNAIDDLPMSSLKRNIPGSLESRIQDPPIPVVGAKKKPIDESYEQYQINKEAPYSIPNLNTDIKIRIY